MNDFRAVAHVSEGLLPVLVLADLAPVRMGNGKPGRRVQVLKGMYGYRKGMVIRVATAMLTVPGKPKPGKSASQRRKDRAATQRHRQAPKPAKATLGARRAEAGRKASPSSALVPLEGRDIAPLVSQSAREVLCQAGCGTALPFTTTLATGQTITVCPSCKADMNA